MKLLRPLQIGDIVRTNYGTGPHIIVEIQGPCTCGNYVQIINRLPGERIIPRPPHWHFTVVDETAQPTKDGYYRERDFGWLGGYVYQNGECVDVDGPHHRDAQGWHEEDDGWDKIKLIQRGNPFNRKPLTKPKPKTETDNDEDEEIQNDRT